MPGHVSLSPALVRTGAWLLATLVVGWVVVGWFWGITAPDIAPRVEQMPLRDHQAAANAIASRHLFGRASSAGDEMGGEYRGVNLRLLGAMTSSPEAMGFAILAEEGKPSVAALEGETFMPGVTLVEIMPGKVRVKIGDREEIIEMAKQVSTQQAIPEPGPVVAQPVPGDQEMSDRRTSRRRPELPRP